MWKTPGSPDKGLLHPSFSCPSLRRRDGVTELTSWITSNTLLEAGQPNLPPPRLHSLSLCVSLFLPMASSAASVSLHLYPDTCANKATSSFSYSTNKKSPYGLFQPPLCEYVSVSTSTSGKYLLIMTSSRTG